MPRSIRQLTAAALFVLLASTLAGASGSEEKSPEEEAVETEKKAMAKYNDGVSRMKRADDLMAKGDRDKAGREYEQAAKRFKESLEYKPKFPEALNNLGYSLRLTGRYEEALRHYGEAIKLKPDFWEAHEYRARAYLALDSVAQANSEHKWLVDHKHTVEAESLKVAIDAWVLARAEGKKVSVEKKGW